MIAFLRKGNLEMPSVLFDISRKPENGRTNNNPPETAAEREEHDTWFLTRLSDYPLDKQTRIDRCRELLNELGGLGIFPEGMAAAKEELQEARMRFDSINRQINETSEKHRQLKRLEHNLVLASNPRFTHGPLFDDDSLNKC